MLTVLASYAKHGESGSGPMNDVLTTTLKAIRMDTAAERWRFCSSTGTLYQSSHSVCENAGQGESVPALFTTGPQAQSRERLQVIVKA